MSARSSTRSALVAIALAACGKSSGAPAAAPAEADPAAAAALAAKMLANAPSPASARDCTHADLAGGLTLTQPTLLRVARKPVADDPEHAAWMNPPELDAPAARALAAGPDRRAAAQFLAAPFYVVYRLDNVDAPLALGIKELKRSTVSARVIRYDKAGVPACVSIFLFQDDKAVSQDAIARSDKTLVDPAVADLIRKNLAAQFIAHAPR